MMMMKYLVLVLYDDDESLPRVGVALDALEHDVLNFKKKKKKRNYYTSKTTVPCEKYYT